MTHHNNHGDHFDHDLFRETLIELSRQTVTFGEIKHIDKELPGKNASCGDSVTWQVELSKDGKKITALRWEGEGCVISMASANAVVEMVREEQTVNKILSWNEHDVLEAIGLTQISPGREKCLLLGLSTLQKGLYHE
jgi:nitrogen fixation protein NifU and related proteins